MSKNLSADVIALGAVTIQAGTADPTAGGGVAAPVGSVYFRNTSTIGIYSKTGAGNTAWTYNNPSLTIATTGSDPRTGGGVAGSVGDLIIWLNGTSSELFMKMSSSATDWQPANAAGSTRHWWGDGSDGAVTISADTNEAGTRGAVNYTNLTIDAGFIYRNQGRVVFVSDTLTINGTIAQNGGNGATSVGSGGGAGGSATNAGAATQPLRQGSTGGAGGTGSAAGSAGAGTGNRIVDALTTGGNGGSNGGANAGGAGGAGNSLGGGYEHGFAGPITGSPGLGQRASVLPTNGLGSGCSGGGGGGSTSHGGGGGGAGGGNILIYARRIVWGASGSIESKGGNGGDGHSTGNTGGGGGGGGGVAQLIFQQMVGTPNILVTAGTKGLKGGTGNDGVDGAAGFSAYRKV